MVTGRPPHDLEKMAKELIEWSYLPDSLNLIGFSSPRRISVTRLPAWAEENERLREALTLAKENIAQNRFRAANEKRMPEVFYNRCEGMYDPLYHKYDNDEKDKDARRKKDIEGAKQSTYNIVVPHDLAIGSNISAASIPNPPNKSSK